MGKKSITAYGYSVNCKIVDIPFMECLTSLLQVCDEVIIIDSSVDGTFEELQQISGLTLYRFNYDYDLPTADGVYKNQARQMVKTDLCWGIDLDEIIHEKDYTGWRDIINDIDKYDMLILPRVDFWSFDLFQLRYRYDAIFKNNSRWQIGHPKSAIQKNPITGKDIVKNMHYEFVDRCTLAVPERQIKWVPNQELLTLFDTPRTDGKEELAKIYTDYVINNPTLYHYSHASLFRSVINKGVFNNNQNRMLCGEINYWDERWNTSDYPSLEAVNKQMKYLLDYGYPYLVDGSNELNHPPIMNAWIERWKNPTVESLHDYYDCVKNFYV